MGSLNSESTTRQIIDAIFSMQWCKENLVAPLGFQVDVFSGKQMLTIAIGKISYLGTIGQFIAYRAEDAGYTCQFIERDPTEITQLLDQVSNE